jgi:hypothetical protein
MRRMHVVDEAMRRRLRRKERATARNGRCLSESLWVWLQTILKNALQAVGYHAGALPVHSAMVEPMQRGDEDEW